MQEQVADNLAQVLHCALDTSRKAGREELSQDSIKLYLKACALEQAVDPPSDEIQDLLKQVTQQQPDFAAAWARLAFFAANAAFRASPADVPKLRSEARIAAQEALRLDPKSGVAYNAIAELELGHVPFAVLHSQFQRVLRFDSDDTFTINNECELLMRMGSIEDSLRMCRRGVALEPLSPVQVSDLVAALIADSRNAEAQTTLNRALRIWPDDAGLKLAKLDYEARQGDPTAALSILKNPDTRPPTARDITLEAYRRLAEARLSKQPTQIVAFMDWLKREVAADQLDVAFVAPLIAEFGDVDGAFKIALAYRGNVINIDPAFLWQPESLPLRRDPRFIGLAAKLHVADFWATTGSWPDFCSTPNWPYNCTAEEKRVADARAWRG
jgi:tetratricopeptide (TPR) repeat protein